MACQDWGITFLKLCVFHSAFCMIVFSNVLIFKRFLPNEGIFCSLSLYSELLILLELKDFLLCVYGPADRMRQLMVVFYASHWRTTSRLQQFLKNVGLQMSVLEVDSIFTQFLPVFFCDYYPNGHGSSFLVIAVQFFQGTFELYFNTRVVYKTSLFQRQVCMLFLLSNCNVVFCSFSLLKRKCMDKNSHRGTAMRPLIFLLHNTQMFVLGRVGKV